MPGNSPLIDRAALWPLAADDSGLLTTRDLLSEISILAQALPPGPYAINVCSDRLNFVRSMLAVIAKGQCNLLPPNRQPATIQGLLDRYPDAYIVHDGTLNDLPSHQAIDVTIDQTLPRDPASGATESSPLIPDDQIAAISFTSGSTGESKPNIKTWATLRRGNEINVENMLQGAPKGLHLLATVPPQHMYGLELSVLLPTTTDTCVHSGQPLFPADVAKALENMPAPRALVSTPQHLRVLVGSGLSFPTVARVFSATAPLDQTLAKEIEAIFGGVLIEIFGCSEIGSLARRETAREENWSLFSAMSMNTTDGGEVTVTAPHITESVVLQDMVTVHSNNRFSVSGRQGDLVNVAGKRGSLAQLTGQLLSIDGVVDGVVFNPSDVTDTAGANRLAAIVVAPGVERQTILATLRKQIDPVFLPRPLLFSDALPRSETSKLPRAVLLEHYRSLRKP